MARHRAAARACEATSEIWLQRETVRVSDDRRVPFDAAAYVERSRNGDCFACRVAGGVSPRREFVVHRDDRYIAFLPNFHVQLGYVLVAPIEHREGVVEDFPLDDYLALQTLVRAVGRALSLTVPTERIYVLSLGSQQGNAHVHWHVVALPHGVPYEQQQFFALMHAAQGVLDLTDDERSELADELRAKIATELHAST
jgi:diadenosine tetraphosphate (Ap4A) HIT family hydrolase